MSSCAFFSFFFLLFCFFFFLTVSNSVAQDSLKLCDLLASAFPMAGLHVWITMLSSPHWFLLICYLNLKTGVQVNLNLLLGFKQQGNLGMRFPMPASWFLVTAHGRYYPWQHLAQRTSSYQTKNWAGHRLPCPEAHNKPTSRDIIPVCWN